MAAIAALGVGLSVLAYIGALHREEARVRELAGFRADWRVADLERRLQRLSGPASALAAFLGAQPDITAETIGRFPLEMIEGTSVLRTLFWAPRVPGRDRFAFEQKMRADGYPEFAISAPQPNGGRAPAAAADEYFPVLYQTSSRDSPIPLGLDATSGEAQRQAAAAASASGRPVISSPDLVGDERDLRATVFVPVYRTDHVPGPAARAEALKGYVGGSVQVLTSLNAAIAGTPTIIEQIFLSAGTSNSEPFAAYDPATGVFGSAPRAASVAALPGYTLRRPVNFLGTTWTAVFDFAPDTLASMRTPGQWLWLLAGLLLTSAVVAAIGMSYRRVIQAEQTVSAGERALRKEASARVRSEEAERQALERLQAVIDNAHDAIITIDANGRIDTFNKAATRIFGYSPDDVFGRNVNVLMPSPYNEAHDGYLQNYLTTGHAKIIGMGREVEARRRDGTVFPIDLSVAEMNVGGRRSFIGVIRDISGRKQAEAARDQAQRRIRELTAEMVHMSRLTAMGQLSSALAHELNQPLTAIANYTEAARQLLSTSASPPPPRVAEFLEKGANQAERAGQIIRRLRGFVEKGTLERVEASLSETVKEATELGMIGAGVSGIQIVYELAPDLPPVHVDKVQIQQVVVNLVRNAAEVLRGRERRVVAVRTRAADDGYQEVAVIDTGPGIAPEIADQLFKPFVTTKPEGMGIGLSICRSIIEAHRGRIWTEPNPGGGTIVRFVVPEAADGARSA